MLDHLLEKPTQQSIYDNAWLMMEFEKQIVGPSIRDSRVIAEIESGTPTNEVLDDIWKGFENWADEYLHTEKQSYEEE